MADVDTDIEAELRAEIDRLRRQVASLMGTVRDQARTLAELTDECPPWAPSLAIVYWLYGPTRWSEPCWPAIANMLRHLLRDIGDLPAAKLTPMVWEAHRARRRAEVTIYGRPPTEGVLNNALGRTKEMLSWAVENKLLKFNPLAPARAVKTVVRRETWLSAPEVDRLLEACPLVVNQRLPKDDGWRARVLRAFVLCCHDSMLRFNEARRLLRARIGQDGRVELASRLTKGNKRRVVFLTPRTLKAISQLEPEPNNPYVFGHRAYGKWSLSAEKVGGPIGEKRLSVWFRRLCEASGIDAFVAPGERRLHAHDLRASGASTADEMGARPTAIRDALGHARLATTEVYLRSGQAENARSVAIVMAGVNRMGPKKSLARPKKFDGTSVIRVQE